MAEPLHILIADDEEIVLSTLGDYLSDLGHEVHTVADGNGAAERISAKEYDLALVDVRMPGKDGMEVLETGGAIRPEMPIVIITGHGSMETAVQALRKGAADFLQKPVKLLELDAVLEKVTTLRDLRIEGRVLKETIRHIQREGGGTGGAESPYVFASSAMSAVSAEIDRVAASGCDTVLVTGPTGSGKEVVAREIHRRAASGDAPFIAVSCPAIPDTLIESELFGHRKGAYTGAMGDRTGCFQMAHGGTLFLDEIGDLSKGAQAKLLRVLETRSFRRVGGGREVRVDVRIIAATNAPLEERIEAGGFRSDLYYRLNLYTISLPPLKDRTDDVLPLAEYFLEAYSRERGIAFEGIDAPAKEALESYGYPGNIRELKNIVERAAILSGGGSIRLEHLPVVAGFGSAHAGAGESEGEARRIREALEKTRWNRREAARLLGMPYSTLRYRVRKLGLVK